MGRFAQADTIVPGGVQGWDRYAYGLNNPLSYTDPTGHEPKGPDSCYAYDWNTGECSDLGVDPDSESSENETDDATPEDIFDDMADESDIAFNFPIDGCYARAQLMSQRIKDRYGMDVDKVWAFGYLQVETDGAYGEVTWGYHVAPVITVTNDDGSTTQWVIDPSISDQPITVDEWLTIMNTSTNEADVQITTEGQAPNYPNTDQSFPGSGYWPGQNPSYYGGSLTYYSHIIMEMYGACGAAGVDCFSKYDIFGKPYR